MKIGKCSLCYAVYMTMVIFFSSCQGEQNSFQLNQAGYFESDGADILVFSNWYNGMFSDSKMSGIELIHHGVRTVTNGDIRLEPTPEQWDAIPTFLERKVDTAGSSIAATLSYPDYSFKYRVKVEGDGEKILIKVVLEEPLPETLEGKAGFNLEFLPSAYFHKTFDMDGNQQVFPRYPSGPMEMDENQEPQPLPLARGKHLVMAPEDPERMVTIESVNTDLLLYDGRNAAQNGWFVVRSIIPSGAPGNVIEWILTPQTEKGWSRKPVIAHSQIGYHPDQEKVAVIEADRNTGWGKDAFIFRVSGDGEYRRVFKGKPVPWGEYLRYKYATVDFSGISTPGIYLIEYDGIRTAPFIIGENVLKQAWQPTLDIFFPVQMDHMLVNEAYRVWHGAAHLDDARQAPVNHAHFDLYGQGPVTDSPYQPGEHIPGLNVGGWFDAGDYDIRTQSQYTTVMDLVSVWEEFSVDRDQTTVNEKERFVDLHRPDGRPDILQQIEHGALGLLAQHRAVGHAIPGIIVPDLSQYTHLGDAITMTDNLVYDPGLAAGEKRGTMSGIPDDRWAFTSRSTALNYGSSAGLAAASRALREYNPGLAAECLETAEKVWDEEQGKKPDRFRMGNTTGGRLDFEEFRAAVELLVATGEKKYRDKINRRVPMIERGFGFMAADAVRVIPYMEDSYGRKLRSLTIRYKQDIDSLILKNPYGVPVTGGGWAGSGRVIGFSVTNYYLNKAFPDIMSPEDVYRGLNYIYGCHPGSDISFVSAVGTQSKEVAYGSNRADFSFIAGGIVPGVLILPPDYPENKEDWPFLWGENEYVISLGAPYMFAVFAADRLLNPED